jgi:alkylation response protein AidB-like acyl-CoA dehydrogenase
LSLFFVPLRNEKGVLNNILIHRLKDKMGTYALPTAELTLNGTPAQMIGPEGQGVKTIATILNITRLFNLTFYAVRLLGTEEFGGAGYIEDTDLTAELYSELTF